MQKLLFALVFCCLSLPSLTAQNLPKVEVFFQRYHTKTDLTNIREELKSMKILIEYTDMAFDADGRLTELAFTVDCQDGHKGSAKTDNIPTDLSFGFIRDYRADAASSFSIGNIGSAVK